MFQLFEELVSIPEIATRRNFSLEVVLTVEEVRRRQIGRRGRWRTSDRILVRVEDRALFRRPADYAALLPAELDEPFTNRDLAEALGRPRWLAEKMTYSLRRMGAIATVGKRRRANLYRLESSPTRSK